MSNNQISIDGNNNIVLQDINSSHVYINSDDGVRKLLQEQEGKMQEILSLLKAKNEPRIEQFTQKVDQITSALDLIDTDMLAAFDQLDKVAWGNERGTYFDLKKEWIHRPNGFNEPGFRGRLKIFVKMYWK